MWASFLIVWEFYSSVGRHKSCMSILACVNSVSIFLEACGHFLRIVRAYSLNVTGIFNGQAGISLSLLQAFYRHATGIFLKCEHFFLGVFMLMCAFACLC